MRALGCLPVFFLCLAVSAARTDDKPDGLAAFQGQWRLAGAREDGKELDVSGLRGLKIVFKGDKVVLNGEPKIKFTVDAASDPKIIDLFVDDDRIIEGIYRFQGTTLTICLHNPEGVRMRPVSFREAGAKVFTLERVKRE